MRAQTTKDSNGEEGRWTPCDTEMGTFHGAVLALAAVGLLVLLSCGGSSPSAGSQVIPGTQTVSVTVFPRIATVPQGASESFGVTVLGTANRDVTWSLQEGATGGSVNALGVYTAPPTPGTYHLIATSQAATSSSATATITVPSVSISISPTSAAVNPGATRQFTADVEGTVNQAVGWSVEEGPMAGSISADGIYTAPATVGTFHVLATSMADPGKSALASVNVGAGSGSFNPTQSMLSVSGIHTATLLPNGTVLVAGGSKGWTEDWDEAGQNDAEIYSAGSFATTGSLTAKGRTRHTATLLPNGKVLLTGGEGTGLDQPPVLSSAELYDPALGSFSAAAGMAIVRVAHTATLLPNGKVLIAGGGGDGGWGFPVFGDAAASAEIYDPSTDTFTPTGSMGTPRFAHTATLLPNGKVLIAGGYSSGRVNGPVVPLATTEIYDPSTGVFAPGSSMTNARGGHTATLLLNGAVLIAGGLVTLGSGTYYPPTPGSSVVLSAAELWDPTTGAFTSTGDMTAEREEHTATLMPNGKVLLVGGATGSQGTLATAEIYDPAAGTFAVIATMSTTRSGHSATLLPDGSVLITGGNGAGGRFDTGNPGLEVFLRSAEIYTPTQ